MSAKKPFQPIPSPFGTGIDEQATIAAFKEYIGDPGRLETLWRIARNAYPMPKYPHGLYTSSEVLRMRAKKEGFTDLEIDGYFTFGN